MMWEKIKDYETAPQELQAKELRGLSGVWQEQKQALQTAAEMVEFNRRLNRKWAIETGLLERLYTLDRGVTQLLVERGIDASLIPHGSTNQNPEELADILHDHEEAIEWLFDFVKGDRPLTTSFVNELHALLTRHQRYIKGLDPLGRSVSVPLERGKYKQQPNNPTRRNGNGNGSIHEYCPPEHVAAEMDRLLQLHDSHTDEFPEVEASWLHHRFTQIHPFSDGNGRVARALATLVLIRAGWFPLVVEDDHRADYIRALEAADGGDLKPLVALITVAQKKAFVEAIGISSNVLQPRRAEQFIDAIQVRKQNREQQEQQQWHRAKEGADRLYQIAVNRLEELIPALRTISPEDDFFVDKEPGGGSRYHYFRSQIINAAQQSAYWVNLSEYHAWTRLVLRTGSTAEILISFHATGREYRGVLACTAIFFRRDLTDAGESEIAEVQTLAKEFFQINYREDPADRATRFRDWLEDCIVSGLDAWQKGL